MANEFLNPSFYTNTPEPPKAGFGLPLMQSDARARLDLAGATTLQTVDILDGSITPTGAHIAVDTEGQAPSDELININPIRNEVDIIHEGMILQLQAVDDARVVTVKNSSEVGGIRTLSGQDVVLGTSWRLQLQYIGGAWVEIASKSQRDANLSLATFSATSAIGKAPIAIDDGDGNPVFDDTVKEAMGLRTKASIDMDNISDAGRSAVSGFGMPSDQNITIDTYLTLVEGTHYRHSYVAPADGRVSVGVPMEPNGILQVRNRLVVFSLPNIANASTMTFSVPVSKGQTVTTDAHNPTTTAFVIYFTYNQGEI